MVTASDDDYVVSYEDFWKAIVENPDGSLNRDQVMRELHDYQIQMREVSKTYDDLTRGRISKPNTTAHHVIREASEVQERETKEALAEELEQLADGLCCGGVLWARAEEIRRELS
ncbi:MAG TPA: hypothetical protein VIV12_22870 [Streptosporangiaceae bacterium]